MDFFDKEEAIKAKEVAEKKMESKDYTGAHKFILKAQKLHPHMENISQMLMVCDVHCAAEKRLFGNEMDWYGILQIEQTANEATIKKQYRKYALLLHPDKNKFIGAEAAFKLIGEAQRVLLDQEKRRLHDMRRKPAVTYRPPQRGSSNFSVGVQTSFRSNFSSFHPQHQQPQQQGQSGSVHNRATFWTVCPFCSIRYQYYKEVLNRSLCCQNCKKPYVAYDMEVQGVQPVTNLNHTSFFQQQSSFNQGLHRADMGCRGNSQSEKPRTESRQKTRNSSEAPSEKFYGKKKRQASESSESCETGSSSDFEETVVTDEDGDIHSRKGVGGTGQHNPRRSSRHRQKVSYNEVLSDDDDFVITPKKSKRSNSSCTSDDVSEGASKDEAADVNDDWREIKQKKNDCSEGSLSSRSKEKKVSHKETSDEDDYQRSMDSSGDPELDSAFKKTSESNLFSCCDTDFYNFDKLRNQECFSTGQIWALYDNIDAMPRFYARIKKVISVISTGFKVQVTWLEPKVNDNNQNKRVDQTLPVSCGQYVFGFDDSMEEGCSSMFSHIVSWEKGSLKDSFKIYPRKGEIWALFKNWDKVWNCDSGCQYEYEFVEILSDYTEEAGIDVALLGKVEGFSSLFCPMVKKGETSFQVPAVELFRFSHQVPSFQLTGEERKDVPKGSFELDSAALPPNLQKALKEEAANTVPNKPFVGSSNTLESMSRSNGDAAEHKADIESCFESRGNDGSARLSSSPEAFEIPEAEFYDFDADKSHEKFQIGQIWALYSDEDGLPRYYGQIKKIAHDPKFELKLTWLESSALPSNTIEWFDKGMPISCGRFKPKRGCKLWPYTSINSFSHLVRAVPTTKTAFTISPTKGEVWALYRNWTPEMKHSDLDKCDYDIVEVLDDDDLQINVSVLERVNGFNSVFKARTEGASSTLVTGITKVELLRFSHQIPAFQLTQEKDGSLRGFWELDASALPVRYFS